MNRRKFLQSIPLLMVPFLDIEKNKNIKKCVKCGKKIESNESSWSVFSNGNQIHGHDFDCCVSFNRIDNLVKSFDIRYKNLPIENNFILVNHNHKLLRNNVAQWWGILPSKLDKIDIENQELIYATYIANQQIKIINEDNI